MTARWTGCPRYDSAVSFIFVRMKPLIWLGEYLCPPACNACIAAVEAHEVLWYSDSELSTTTRQP